MKKSILVLSLVGTMACGSVAAYASGAPEKKEVTSTQVASSMITDIADVKKEINSLFFNFDDAKYDLVQEEGGNLVYLMEQANEKGYRSNVFVSWKYIPNMDVETAAEEKCKEIQSYEGFTAKIEKSDLEVKSTKVIDKYEEDESSVSCYFIDDNAGGVYQINVNDIVFDFASTEKDLEEIKKSMKVLPKSENENLEKIQEVDPFLG